jgi:hypothetical protein
MTRQVIHGDLLRDDFEKPLDLPRRAHTDRVAQRNFVAPHIEECLGNLRYCLG